MLKEEGKGIAFNLGIEWKFKRTKSDWNNLILFIICRIKNKSFIFSLLKLKKHENVKIFYN